MIGFDWPRHFEEPRIIDSFCLYKFKSATKLVFKETGENLSIVFAPQICGRHVHYTSLQVLFEFDL
jgi:hypothetical protein